MNKQNIVADGAEPVMGGDLPDGFTVPDFSEATVTEMKEWMAENGVSLDGWAKLPAAKKRAALQAHVETPEYLAAMVGGDVSGGDDEAPADEEPTGEETVAALAETGVELDFSKATAKDLKEYLAAQQVAFAKWTGSKLATKRNACVAYQAAVLKGSTKDEAVEAAEAVLTFAASAPDDETPAGMFVFNEPADEVVVEVEAEPKGSVALTVVGETKNGEVSGPDPITETQAKVMDLTAEVATTRVRALVEAGSFDQFILGGYLSRIQQEGWYGEHANFKEFVAAEVGMRHRKALYFVQIYDVLTTEGIAWETISHVGWTKLSIIASILTAKNAAKLAKVAEGMTALQLRDYVATEKKKLAAKAAGETAEAEALASAGTEEVSTITFKVHPDQRQVIEDAIARAMEAAGTDVRTVGFTNICLEYMGKPAVAAQVTEVHTPELTADNVVEVLEAQKAKGAQPRALVGTILEAVEKVFPEFEMEVVIADPDEDPDA